ncbi:hypothetical protein RBI13_19135 [Alcaligenaceae bacterium A4P071]|nr:hypothetical protein [Alcaligenaceae bacterium A4P071]
MAATVNSLTPNEMAGLRCALINAAKPTKKAIPGKIKTVIIKKSVGTVSADRIIEVTAILTAFLLLMGGLMIVSARVG